MSNKSYESLNKNRDELSGDNGTIVIRRKEKGSLRIRFNRIFSSGGDDGLSSLKSSIGAQSVNSRGSRPGRSSPLLKARYSWQLLSLIGHEDSRSPQRSSRCPSPPTPGKSSPVRIMSGNASYTHSPTMPNSFQTAVISYDHVK